MELHELSRASVRTYPGHSPMSYLVLTLFKLWSASQFWPLPVQRGFSIPKGHILTYITVHIHAEQRGLAFQRAWTLILQRHHRHVNCDARIGYQPHHRLWSKCICRDLFTYKCCWSLMAINNPINTAEPQKCVRRTIGNPPLAQYPFRPLAGSLLPFFCHKKGRRAIFIFTINGYFCLVYKSLQWCH